jgi:hypothetical protein
MQDEKLRASNWHVPSDVFHPGTASHSSAARHSASSIPKHA